MGWLSRVSIKVLIGLAAVLPLRSMAASGLGTTEKETDTGLGTTETGKLYNPLGETDVWTLVLKILGFLIQIGAIVIVFMLVYIGFLFVTAQGDPGKLKTARSALLWTVIGALVLLGAQAITLGICETAAALSAGTTITCPSFIP
jgi:hypothetical protein